MKILAHRGYWLQESEKNTKSAIDAAFNNYFGIETDIRDFDNALVVSHDIAQDNNYEFAYLLSQHLQNASTNFLGLNIKCDGIACVLNKALIEGKVNNYFVFDMSIPETLKYLKLNMNVLIRLSEYETVNELLYTQAKGIWLDIFNSIWFTKDVVNMHFANSKLISFVSPELHGRDCMDLWHMIKENNWHKSPLAFLCTDYPDKAQKYFEI